VEERIDADALRINEKQYNFLRDRAEFRINTMTAYAETNTGCRSQTLLRFFGEAEATPCGVCDLCRANALASADVLHPKKVYADLSERLSNDQPITLEDAITSYGNLRSQDTKRAIQQLIDEGLLVRDGQYLRRT